MAKIKDLQGKILSEIKVNERKDEITFITNEGEEYLMYHSQDCCEHVSINDINGDLENLIGNPITLAEEVSNEEFERQFTDSFKTVNEYGWEHKEDENGNLMPESYTWTFYKLATIKGYVDIRWYGESNGFYSESVEFIKLGTEQKL